MEFIHGRPALGQMYCTPRAALNDENEYLSRVGLIVIIRGAPSPDFAWAVIDKMVQTHGGHPQDYQLAQATIAPYVINCPTVTIRDAMVNRGLYTLPQLNAQFAVHQWRPRFGMGYAPSTHQVWVRIIGLTLQAWTNTEITRFLQKFGHPIDILPFGRQGGHFKYITALVNTRHPTHIPLAYVYREGDYSTQVDVLILRWRQWENSYFPPPPPDNPPLAENSTDQVNDSNPTPERHNHSSSGSAPSEPTIDYSSWSPRSNCAKILTAQNGSDDPASSQLATLPQTRKQLTIWSHGSSSLLSSLHEYMNLSTTQDLLLPSGTNRLYLISIPGPIAITSFTSLLQSVTTGGSTPCAARSAPLNADLPLDIVPSAEGGACLGKEKSSLKHNLEDLQRILSVPDQTTCFSISGPDRKQAEALATQVMGLSLSQAHSPNPTLILSSQISSPQSIPGSGLSTLHFDPQNPISMRTPTELSLSDGLGKNNNDLAYNPNRETETQTEELSQDMTEDLPAQLPALANSQTHRYLQAVKTKGKGKKLATRRSPRLQAKQRVIRSPAKNDSNQKIQTVKLPFDLGSHDTPLEQNMAFQILQASGLQINQKIEDMIQEAIKTDRLNDMAVDSSPTTPLHDLVPPLMLSEDDILL